MHRPTDLPRPPTKIPPIPPPPWALNIKSTFFVAGPNGPCRRPFAFVLNFLKKHVLLHFGTMQTLSKDVSWRALSMNFGKISTFRGLNRLATRRITKSTSWHSVGHTQSERSEGFLLFSTWNSSVIVEKAQPAMPQALFDSWMLHVLDFVDYSLVSGIFMFLCAYLGGNPRAASPPNVHPTGCVHPLPRPQVPPCDRNYWWMQSRGTLHLYTRSLTGEVASGFQHSFCGYSRLASTQTSFLCKMLPGLSWRKAKSNNIVFPPWVIERRKRRSAKTNIPSIAKAHGTRAHWALPIVVLAHIWAHIYILGPMLGQLWCCMCLCMLFCCVCLSFGVHLCVYVCIYSTYACVFVCIYYLFVYLFKPNLIGRPWTKHE